MTTSDAAAEFSGFPAEGVAFYDGLEADNSKTFWADHKATYERAVRGPMLALTAALEPEFGEAKLFRPYRDVRFSADKSPYKTHQGAVVGTGTAQGTLYLQVSADGLMIGGGYYVMSSDQLARYRAAVEDDATGVPLADAVTELLAQDFELAGERLKRAPRGIDPAHPRVDLLRHKGIAALRRHGMPPWLATGEAAERIAEGWRALSPLNAWLAAHVGAPRD